MSDFGRVNTFETTLLFAGDVAVFYLSLWAALFLRFLAFPTKELWQIHVGPFTILFIAWVIVFFIGGLYEKHTTFLKNRLPSIILNTQIANSIIAILFFYLIPYFGITPKTILFIYLVVSFGIVLFWRRYWFPAIGDRKKSPAILVGSGAEMHELLREVNGNARYGIEFVSSIDLDEVGSVDFESEILERVYSEDIGTIVIDTKSEHIAPILPRLYNLIFSSVRFIDMHKVYEDIFDRVPLSLVEYSWFLENVSATRKFTYDFLKRFMDILISLPLLIISIVVYPLIALAVKIEDGGSVFVHQNRVGKKNKGVSLVKFRSMSGSDEGDEVLESNLVVTSVGNFLRKTRLDELPQLYDVLQGDLSLIGPRPELPALVKQYEEKIPYYNVRHLIKPGLSGWAQLYHDEHPHHGEGVGETMVKLSYDLYYIKNRSFLLDLKIALKTVKKLISRAGV